YNGLPSTWNNDETVQALVRAGDEAVEPLLRLLGTDEIILTRAFYFVTERWGSHTRNRSPRHVREVAATALDAILQTSFVGSWATPNELAGAGGKPNKIRAAQIRAYWRKFRGVPLEDRWYLTLLDEGGSDAWGDALANIVAPATSQSTPAGEPSPLRGARLRAKTGPSVTELLLKRASTLDLFPFAKWDPEAALRLLRTDMHKHLALWAKAGRWGP